MCWCCELDALKNSVPILDVTGNSGDSYATALLCNNNRKQYGFSYISIYSLMAVKKNHSVKHYSIVIFVYLYFSVLRDKG